MSTQQLNREFRFTFQPKDKEKFGGKRRFSVGAGRLAEYIGTDNAEKVLEKAWEMIEDKKRFKFRVQGIVDVYVK